jgi:hypothetical protein
MKQTVHYETIKSVYDKITKYILNPEHKTGWPKGNWFMLALGFNPDKPEHVKMLARQIRFDSSRAQYTKTTEHGERYSLFLSITGPNGKTIEGIKTTWQIDNGSEFIRLLTILPPQKPKKR